MFVVRASVSPWLPGASGHSFAAIPLCLFEETTLRLASRLGERALADLELASLLRELVNEEINLLPADVHEQEARIGIFGKSKARVVKRHQRSVSSGKAARVDETSAIILANACFVGVAGHEDIHVQGPLNCCEALYFPGRRNLVTVNQADAKTADGNHLGVGEGIVIIEISFHCMDTRRQRAKVIQAVASDQVTGAEDMLHLVRNLREETRRQGPPR
jgi:hypothetical protein